MDSAHRKIELQSPEDLTYLINNVRRAAAEHIGAAFPPVEGGAAEEDELRVEIEGMINDYIYQTFTLAAPNLSINGFELDARTFPAVYLADLRTTNPKKTRSSAAAAANASTQNTGGPDVQYEPFDARKRARLEDLVREEEDLMREIAALKHTIPAATAKGYAEGFWEGVKADEAIFEEVRRNTQLQDEKSKTATLLPGLGQLERQADIERGYLGVVETLGRLRRDLPAVVAKMERARIAGEYTVTER
ncbi:hypothetical protein BD289DRAFT_361879 [Coniella lustricola]|uniref:Kinetochore protein mis14 n=1 Tax=Coniella lustricola TaxID=2025994 RepID=A0A2T3AHK0_9PEZI|nr:hypothetical protein BD289DRAFT_361879 [Coniella lustricola]